MRTPIGFPFMLVAQKEDMITILVMKAAIASERFRNVESFVI